MAVAPRDGRGSSAAPRSERDSRAAPRSRPVLDRAGSRGAVQRGGRARVRRPRERQARAGRDRGELALRPEHEARDRGGGARAGELIRRRHPGRDGGGRSPSRPPGGSRLGAVDEGPRRHLRGRPAAERFAVVRRRDGRPRHLERVPNDPRVGGAVHEAAQRRPLPRGAVGTPRSEVAGRSRRSARRRHRPGGLQWSLTEVPSRPRPREEAGEGVRRDAASGRDARGRDHRRPRRRGARGRPDPRRGEPLRDRLHRARIRAGRARGVGPDAPARRRARAPPWTEGAIERVEQATRSC